MKKCFFLCALLSAILLSAPAFASSSSIPTNISYYCPNCRTGCTFFQSNVSGDICVSSVVVTYRCTRCNSYTITQDYPSAGHDWRENNRTPATCTSSGYVFYRCSRCSSMRQETIPPLGGPHDWSETSRTPATCTVAGSIVSTCSRCRDVKRTDISALGHDMSETSRISATCTSAGSIVRTCSRCNETETETIPQLAHTWKETRTEPTCTAPGSIVSACSVCNTKQSETAIPALGHNMQETSRTSATCTVDGSVVSTCSRCNHSETEVLPALGGECEWEETSRTEATCLPGSIQYTCSKCQDTKTEAIPALENAHTYEVAEIVPAEYDSAGQVVTSSYIRYSCSICGEEYQQMIGVSPPGPTLMDGVGGGGMSDSTASLGKTFLGGIWKLFGIYVPGFSFTFGQMWLGVLLASISILVVRLIFGFGGGPRGYSPRTNSTNRARISKERRNDEF